MFRIFHDITTYLNHPASLGYPHCFSFTSINRWNMDTKLSNGWQTLNQRLKVVMWFSSFAQWTPPVWWGQGCLSHSRCQFWIVLEWTILADFRGFWSTTGLWICTTHSNLGTYGTLCTFIYGLYYQSRWVLSAILNGSWLMPPRCHRSLWRRCEAYSETELNQFGLPETEWPGNSDDTYQGLINVLFFGFVSHHLQISVGICIPNSWVMFNWDIYQPLLTGYR